VKLRASGVTEGNSIVRSSAKETTSEQVMATNSIGITYTPLNTDLNEIRLLTLLSTDTKCVHCTLEHVSLINPPEYVAVSYCCMSVSHEYRISIHLNDSKFNF
jgi:hypothetical protein